MWLVKSIGGLEIYVTNPDRNSILIEQNQYLSFIHLFSNFLVVRYLLTMKIYSYNINIYNTIHNFRIQEQMMTKTM